MLWLATLTPNILYYSHPSAKRSICKCWNHPFLLYHPNNYSQQCQWLAMDIYLTSYQLSKEPPLATGTLVNSCLLSWYLMCMNLYISKSAFKGRKFQNDHSQATSLVWTCSFTAFIFFQIKVIVIVATRNFSRLYQ